MDRELNSSPAPVQGIAGQADDVHGVAPAVGAVGEPGREDLLGAALDHVQQPGRSGAITHWGEVDDHGHVLVTAPGVAPHVLVDADGLHAAEPVLVIDEDSLALGQDGVVSGIPRDAKAFGDTGDGEVLDHDALQRPAKAAA